MQISGAAFEVRRGFDAEVLRSVVEALRGGCRALAHGLPIYMALEPVDMRLGAERLGALVRERMRASRGRGRLFVFVGKRGHGMKILTWDGTGKKLDTGRFELPRATQPGEQHLLVSDAIFDVIPQSVAITPRAPRRRIH